MVGQTLYFYLNSMLTRGIHSPGRFFTAMELKVVSAYIIRRYDFKLDIEKGGTRPQNNSFCFSYSPDSNLDFMLKPKDLTCGSGGS